MGLKGLLDRNEKPSDVESEREALRRQRAEAAAELEAHKRTLSERVAAVQQRERELAEALARVEKREQKLDSAAERGSRLESARLRLAELKQLRTSRGSTVGESVVSTQSSIPVETAEKKPTGGAKKLDGREVELRSRESSVAKREAELQLRQKELEVRSDELDAREDELSAEEPPGESVVSTEAPETAPTVDELAAIEAKLAELGAAEEAFARTHAELAARSDALSELESALAARERAIATKESPEAPELDALEARIRRLEQGGRKRKGEPQTFSAGLRALEERGLRAGRTEKEPLH